ncbi:hypothetical protein GO009_16830 [Muricauda sp. TY007]|uniref:hypothetical protein n=1 Tax=Allomuricauda sp. TY007 TaxID=2683200 RepID=UPI0013BFE386|nr:hypothetical protein [Muricauda sp. TY007]NDV17685.1 hypothetical protein [Muricauda sp. TY007]
MTEQIQINRQTIYLTIESVKIETENGIQEQEHQFVGFFKNEPVTEISLGEQLKDENGGNLVFHSQEQARAEIIEILKRKVYPPSFLNPMDYTVDNLSEIMHKELTFDIGNFNSDDIQESVQGVLTNCTLASNPPHLPASIRIMTNNGERRLSIVELKRIRH